MSPWQDCRHAAFLLLCGNWAIDPHMNVREHTHTHTGDLSSFSSSSSQARQQTKRHLYPHPTPTFQTPEPMTFFFFSSSWHHSALFTTSTPTDSIILLSGSLSLWEWFSLFFLLLSKFSNCIKYCIIITIFTAPWLTEVTLLYYLTVIMHLIRDRVHTLSSICPDWQIPMT